MKNSNDIVRNRREDCIDIALPSSRKTSSHLSFIKGNVWLIRVRYACDGGRSYIIHHLQEKNATQILIMHLLERKKNPQKRCMGGSAKSQKACRLKTLEATFAKKPATYRNNVMM